MIQKNPPLVFLSPRKEFALGYAGNKWTDANINQGYYNGKPYFLELKEGVINKAFNRPGYLHHVDKNSVADSLTGRSMGSAFEVASNKDVTPSKIERIPNVLKALQDSGVTLHNFNPKSNEFKAAVKRMGKRIEMHGKSYEDYIRNNNPELLGYIQGDK